MSDEQDFTEIEQDDSYDDQSSTLNIDDSESSEQLKARKTITNPSRTMDEFKKLITDVYYEELTNSSGEKYKVPVYVMQPQPNPRENPCN